MMAGLDWKPIPKSSNIDAVAHDGEALCVRFKSGQAYRYPGEPASTVDAMLKAESAGKYFNIYVKPFREEYQKMDAESMPKPEDYPGGPLVVGNTVYLEQGPFAHAVSTAMLAALQCRDAPEGGLRTGLHPSVFRMAVELREAIKRACGVPGVEIAVQGWQQLLHTMKPPFPPDAAPKDGEIG